MARDEVVRTQPTWLRTGCTTIVHTRRVAPIQIAMATMARFSVSDVNPSGTLLLPPLFGAIASATSFALMPLFLIAYAILMLANYEGANRLMAVKRGRMEAQEIPAEA